jgi:hypothetical protein
VPEQFPAELSRIVFWKVVVPPSLKMPPVYPPLFAVMVLLLTVVVPPSSKMPPTYPPLFPVMVLLVTVVVPPSLKMPPTYPLESLFPVMVLLLTVSVPSLSFTMPNRPPNLSRHETTRKHVDPLQELQASRRYLFCKPRRHL